MCGICGFSWEDKALISDMCNSMRHRGPNHKASFTDKGISLGYTRLSIIDLKGGNQPIFNERGTIIFFFNGEIYNFSEIKKDLIKKGHKFITEGDGEVIVHAYEEYGMGCVSRFNGMFAFALYDSEKKTLFLARDRLGVKPLYYFWDKEKLVFASEIKAILMCAEIKKEPNTGQINSYFTFRYCPGKDTAFKNIYRLLPGHFMSFSCGSMSIKRYWDLKFSETEISLEDAKDNLRQLLESSVRYRMISDVPVGSLLSGGIDSSTIVAMMRKATSSKINTFTIGFDEGFKNEFRDARLVSQKFGTEHHEYTIGPESLKHLPKIVWHLDEPIADPTSIPNYVLAEKASRKVKVLLNGDGADETFGGYEWYKLMKLWHTYKKIPSIAKNACSAMLEPFAKEPFFAKVKEFSEAENEEDAYISLVSVFGNAEKKAALQPRYSKEDRAKSIIIKLNKEHKEMPGRLNKMLYTDIKTYLPDNMLVKYDKITMAKSIEGRVPFCDYRLAEFSAALPQEYKLKGFRDKFILRKAMAGILPEEIIKKKKQRFLVPTDNWMKRGLKEYAENLIEENKEVVSEFLRKDYIRKLSSSEKSFSYKISSLNSLTGLYYSRQLWTIANFIIWHNQFILPEKIKGPNQ